MRARSLLLGWLILLGLWAWGVSQSLRVSTDLTLFLPGAHSEVQQLLLRQLREGPGARRRRRWQASAGRWPPNCAAASCTCAWRTARRATSATCAAC